MAELYFQLSVGGDTFELTKLPDGLANSVRASRSRGDQIGGMTASSSWALLDVESVEAAVTAVKAIRALQSAAIDDPNFIVGYAHDEQCNLGFSSGEIAALASENMTLSISCWPDPEVR